MQTRAVGRILLVGLVVWFGCGDDADSGSGSDGGRDGTVDGSTNTLDASIVNRDASSVAPSDAGDVPGDADADGGWRGCRRCGFRLARRDP